MEQVTSVDDVPGADTQMRYPVIAAQCCEKETGACRRWVGRNDDEGCIAGFSSNTAPFVTPMTYGETAAKCESLGLTLCERSCKNAGCYYNRHPVFTKLPCAEPPASPPAFGARSPPPPPSPPSPSIPAAPWNPSTTPPIMQQPSEAHETFSQRCKLACSELDQCVGFEETRCSWSSRLCCKLHTFDSTGYFLPSNATYIKHAAASERSKSTAAAGSKSPAQPVVTVAPWDDSYGGQDYGLNTGRAAAPADNVRVNVTLDMLADWRVLLSTVTIFVCGLLLGAMVDHIYMLHAYKSAREFNKAMKAAGPAPAQGLGDDAKAYAFSGEL